MKNVDVKIEGDVMVIKVDISKDFGKSSSGKTTIIASTEGNQEVKKNVFVGLNVYKK